MKHIFIINPKSGKKDSTEYISKYLKENYNDLNYEIYNTTQVGDAIRFVKERCETKKEPITFYACGGDGTLNEVVNGVFGYDDVYITVYPCGSGNDFIKVFGKENHFKDLSNLINGKSRKIDVLNVNGRYSINMCNLGFDGAVAYNMIKFKRWPLVTGKGAYNIALVYSLIFKMKHKCKIYIDEEEVFNGKMLLTAVGNGLCCGGGYYCLPKANVEDGLIDIVYVKTLSRFKFIGLVGKYKDGTYLGDPKYDKYMKYTTCKKIKLISEKPIAYSIDGECDLSNEININIEPKAINFVVPTQYENMENLTKTDK